MSWLQFCGTTPGLYWTATQQQPMEKMWPIDFASLLPLNSLIPHWSISLLIVILTIIFARAWYTRKKTIHVISYKCHMPFNKDSWGWVAFFQKVLKVELRSSMHEPIFQNSCNNFGNLWDLGLTWGPHSPEKCFQHFRCPLAMFSTLNFKPASHHHPWAPLNFRMIATILWAMAVRNYAPRLLGKAFWFTFVYLALKLVDELDQGKRLEMIWRT